MENIQNYINHVSSHLMKENLRLFVMADTLLCSQSHNINNALERIENDKLKKLENRENTMKGWQIIWNLNLKIFNIIFY